MKFDNQLRYAATIIDDYHGEGPLHTWLKSFFRDHPQMGSKDRRIVSNMVYGFYRLGHALRGVAVDERVLLGLFLCSDAPLELLHYFRPEWNERTMLPLEEKISWCGEAGIDFDPLDIFPWKNELSDGIDHRAFCLSFLRQPDLFLRIRPGYQEKVLEKLGNAAAAGSQGPEGRTRNISEGFAKAFEFIPPFTVRLPNGFKVEDLFTPDKEVVVQDYSSQRLASFLQFPVPAGGSGASGGAAEAAGHLPDRKVPLSFWDACAASGGKSILAADLNPGLDITVSDVREPILQNLRQRFLVAGITQYQSFVADLTVPAGGQFPYDLILADVPCTGSGTWSRTPEELYFFQPIKIGTYAERQKKIMTNIIPHLSKGAKLVYSTCSVFKKENENIVAGIRKILGREPERMEVIKGYADRADTMFAAQL